MALVIGNQNYDRRPLRNSIADARSMKTLLLNDLSFTEVREFEDLRLAALQQDIRDFERAVRPGDLVFFYYSGHGMQVGGVNWIIPTDFHANFEDEVPDQAFSAQMLLRDLLTAGAAVRVVVLDACRDSPLPTAQRKSGKGGLAPMDSADGTYILFSTAENQTASDNPRGSNGLFTTYLLEALRQPGLSLDAVFKQTRREVAAASGGLQRPWLATDIDRDVFLIPPRSGSAAREDPATEAWRFIQNSTNPADFEQFTATFPDSKFVAISKSRAAELREALRTPPPNEPRQGIKVNTLDGLAYVRIAAGTFYMGCSRGDRECFDDEQPVHKVTLTKDFWIGQTEVTQRAFQTVMKSNPSNSKGDLLPVEQVTWIDADSYCRKVGMRLPTEAEWEYSARGGSESSRYASLDSSGWYKSNSSMITHVVGKLAPNDRGLYDMLGNVNEWVADWYARYSPMSSVDPKGPDRGKERVFRGGSWAISPEFQRASMRLRRSPNYKDFGTGFRCAGN
jgi:formylglycine-generating enzyme required for sulfatase activity